MRTGKLPAISLFLFALLLVGESAEASLASTAYSLLRWLDSADLVHHEIEATIDLEKGEAAFVDEALFTSAGKRTIHFLLGVDAVLERVEWVDGEQSAALPFATTLRLNAIPFGVYRVTLPRAVPKGAPFHLRFHYRITRERAHFLTPYIAPDYFYLGYAALWYPHMPNEDFFTAGLSVWVPEGYVAVADGEPGEPVRENGWERRRFRVDHPVNRLGLGVGLLERAEVMAFPASGRPLRIEVFAPAGALGRAQEAARLTAGTVRFLEERLGALPLSRFYVAELPFDLAASYTGLHGLVYGGDLSLLGLEGSDGLALLAAHEAAHKWLGGVIGARIVGGAWFIEGLAEYLGHLALEQLVGEERAARLFDRRVYTPFVTKLRTGSGRPLAAIEIFDDDSLWIFEKGSLLFRMLHHLLGDDAFFGLLRAFLAEHEGLHVSPADFTRFAASWTSWQRLPHSGRELERFFDTWVRGTGRLDYALERVGVAERESGVELRFEVTSRGQASFPGSVPVLIEASDGSELWVEARAGVPVSVALSAAPLRVIVDPRHILADADPSNNSWTASAPSLD